MSDSITLAVKLGAIMCSKEERTVSGLLLPFKEIGRTSVGRLKARPGVIEIPRDPSAVVANSEHDRFKNLGHATDVHETEKGIFATFKIVDTPEGDELLSDIPEGKRSYLSVELAPGNTIGKGGEILAAKLTGAAFTSNPAFESAAVFASATETDPEVSPTPESAGTPASKPESEAIVPEVETPEAAVVPEGIQASRPKGRKQFSDGQVLSLLAARASKKISSEGLKALAEVGGVLEQGAPVFASYDFVSFEGSGSVETDPSQVIPQWLGHIYQGVYSQGLTVIRDLVAHADLTSRTGTGFKVTTFPTGGSWAGNGAAITSGGFATTPENFTSVYWAGADTIGREYLDWGISESLLNAYFGYQVQNYQHATDQALLAAVTPGSATMADNPTGLGIPAAWSQLIDALFEVINNYGGTPTFALVEPSLWKSMAKTPTVQALAYLTDALGISEGDLAGLTIRPDVTHTLATGNILAGNGQNGATLYELPGVPVRAQALNAIASIDVGLIGYYYAMLNNANSFALVEPYAA